MAEKTIFMTREQHQKWDAALRSGEYKQGNGSLKTPDGKFCCLGVLEHCLTGVVEDVAVPTFEWLQEKGIRFCDTYSPSMGSRVPFLPKLRDRADAANDHGTSFEEIADAIAEAVEYTDS